MCDLWRYTTSADTPRGAIPAQIAAARERLCGEQPAVTHLKLYNAGSFFDPRAIPEEDYEAVAATVRGFSQIVVESHPALVGARVDRFLDALDVHRACDRPAPRLEIAMGLETVHPDALERLHKRMTVEQFVNAAQHLARRGVAVRAFLLIAPPFVPRDDQDAWLMKSIDVAFACGAFVVTLIPTRDGNGAMEALSSDGSFQQPRLDDIERSVDLAYARDGHRGRLFVDLWDLQRFSDCPACFTARRDRLHMMNLGQRALPRIACDQHAR
jgi:radical SAM enzyme (TIGR01210 family)